MNYRRYIRSAKKEKKVYLWDWSSIESTGSRFENLVASQLLQYCHYIEDTEGDTMELRFMRDAQKREVDFVILKNKEPIFAVECKTGEKSLSPHIRYFKERTAIPYFYQVHRGKKDYLAEDKIRVLPFLKFCDEVLI
jgi:predicted AAA+ superfamily ATPase